MYHYGYMCFLKISQNLTSPPRSAILRNWQNQEYRFTIPKPRTWLAEKREEEEEESRQLQSVMRITRTQKCFFRTEFRKKINYIERNLEKTTFYCPKSKMFGLSQLLLVNYFREKPYRRCLAKSKIRPRNRLQPLNLNGLIQIISNERLWIWYIRRNSHI